MEPNFTRLFKLTFIAIALVFFCNQTFGQTTKGRLVFNYSVDSTKVGDQYLYSISIKVNEGIGPFTYYLYVGDPLNGGQVLHKSENIQATSYSFNKIKRSDNYHVGVKGLTKRDMNLMYINF